MFWNITILQDPLKASFVVKSFFLFLFKMLLQLKHLQAVLFFVQNNKLPFLPLINETFIESINIILQLLLLYHLP